jgi:cytidylate kinase
MKPIVAIDGPAGAGKSSVSRLLARRLGFIFIDSGAMYRAVALISKRRNIDWADEAGVSTVAKNLSFTFLQTPNGTRCIVNGLDETENLRSPDISQGSSIVAVYKDVRIALDKIQKDMGVNGGIVIEGRDIATTIFPNADVKIFLTATPETRTQRRIAELKAKTGEVLDYETTLAETKERDARDMNREHSPLRKAVDATEIYTDNHTIDEVVEKLASLVPYYS